MRTPATVTLMLALLIPALPAHALPGFSFGIDGAVTVPFGDWADVSGMGVGALGYASFNLAPAFKPTVRVGYIHRLDTDSPIGDVSISHVPVLAGLKWYMLPAMPIYLAGELGMVMSKKRSPLCDSDWEQEWGATVGAGFSLLSFDLRAALFMPNLEHIDDMSGLLATVGYRF